MLVDKPKNFSVHCLLSRVHLQVCLGNDRGTFASLSLFTTLTTRLGHDDVYNWDVSIIYNFKSGL